MWAHRGQAKLNNYNAFPGINDGVGENILSFCVYSIFVLGVIPFAWFNCCWYLTVPSTKCSVCYQLRLFIALWKLWKFPPNEKNSREFYIEPVGEGDSGKRGKATSRVWLHTSFHVWNSTFYVRWDNNNINNKQKTTVASNYTINSIYWVAVTTLWVCVKWYCVECFGFVCA